MSDPIHEVQADVKEIKHILTGNGKPQDGVIFQLKWLTRCQQQWNRAAYLLISGALLALGAWAVMYLLPANNTAQATTFPVER